MYEYDYTNTYETVNDGGMIALGVLAIVLIVYFAILALGIANYVMTSLSLHRIAARRQIANPWLAWLPIANNWIIGSIADDYEKQQGRTRKWRTALLILSLIGVGGFILSYIALIVMVIVFAVLETNTEPSVSAILGGVVPFYILLLLAVMLLAAAGYCTAVCVFKIFESTVPEKALKYFLIYLLVPLGGGICLMKCKDKGYSNPAPVYPYYNPPVIPQSETAPIPEQNQDISEENE